MKTFYGWLVVVLFFALLSAPHSGFAAPSVMAASKDKIKLCDLALTPLTMPQEISDIPGWQDYIRQAEARVRQVVSDPKVMKELKRVLKTTSKKIVYGYVLNELSLVEEGVQIGFGRDGFVFRLSDYQIKRLNSPDLIQVNTVEYVARFLSRLDYKRLPEIPFLRKLAKVVLPSSQAVQDLWQRHLQKSLEEPTAILAKNFMEEFGLAMPEYDGYRCKWNFDLWKENRLHNQRDRFYAALISAAVSAKDPVKHCLDQLINRTLARDHERIWEQAQAMYVARDPEEPVHPWADWTGDSENPDAMELVSEVLENKSGKFIDIGSGTGEPLLLLAPRFPQMQFVGYDIFAPKVRSANQLASQFYLNNLHYLEQDLSDPNFQVPAADYYYLFNPLHYEVLRKVMRDIAHSTERQEKTTVILRGLSASQATAIFAEEGRPCVVELKKFGMITIVRCEAKPEDQPLTP